MKIVEISPIKANESDIYRFDVTILSHKNKPTTINMSASELLSADTFIKIVLENTGFVFPCGSHWSATIKKLLLKSEESEDE